nr:putative ribonuclease H-like domain-containing protein [Tanacetum cinerariifolium]
MPVPAWIGNPQQEVVNSLNHVYHSKTKHIEIRHHFVKDSYEKRLIEMGKIHTDNNVADLLTKAFDQTAALSTIEDDVMTITATIDRKVKVLIIKAFIRRHLKLEVSEGLSTLPTEEIFEQLDLMSPKKTAWEQFSSNIATVIICLETNKTFNFSKLIFDAMTSKARRKARIVISEDEDELIKELDMDVGISLVPSHAADQGKSDDTQISGQPEEQLGVFSTAKRIQVQMSMDEELAQKLHEEEHARFNVKQEEINKARQEKGVAEADQAHDISLSDPAVIRYHAL